MTNGSLRGIKLLTFDIFGTVVDWRSGVADQVNRIAKEHGVRLDGGAFADVWRGRYLPSMNLVRRKELPWMNLDALHSRHINGTCGSSLGARAGPFPCNMLSIHLLCDADS